MIGSHSKQWARNDRSLRRSEARGEAVFRDPATSHSLIPNKCKYNFGSEFLCRVEEREAGRIARDVRVLSSKSVRSHLVGGDR